MKPLTEKDKPTYHSPSHIVLAEFTTRDGKGDPFVNRLIKTADNAYGIFAETYDGEHAETEITDCEIFKPVIAKAETLFARRTMNEKLQLQLSLDIVNGTSKDLEGLMMESTDEAHAKMMTEFGEVCNEFRDAFFKFIEAVSGAKEQNNDSNND